MSQCKSIRANAFRPLSHGLRRRDHTSEDIAVMIAASAQSRAGLMMSMASLNYRGATRYSRFVPCRKEVFSCLVQDLRDDHAFAEVSSRQLHEVPASSPTCRDRRDSFPLSAARERKSPEAVFAATSPGEVGPEKDIAVESIGLGAIENGGDDVRSQVVGPDET